MNKSNTYPILVPHTNCLKKTLIMDGDIQFQAIKMMRTISV